MCSLNAVLHVFPNIQTLSTVSLNLLFYSADQQIEFGKTAMPIVVFLIGHLLYAISEGNMLGIIMS